MLLIAAWVMDFVVGFRDDFVEGYVGKFVLDR
jgi:hypothetical protein